MGCVGAGWRTKPAEIAVRIRRILAMVRLQLPGNKARHVPPGKGAAASAGGLN